MSLVSRHEFEHCLEHALYSACIRQPHALLYLELEGLDAITASYGDAARDALLVQWGYVLLPELGRDYPLAQVGDSHFVILLQQHPLEQALQEARLLRTALQNFLFHWQDDTFRLGVHIGLVLLTHDTDLVPVVLAAAEEACHEARRKGGNCIQMVCLKNRQMMPIMTEWQAQVTAIRSYRDEHYGHQNNDPTYAVEAASSSR